MTKKERKLIAEHLRRAADKCLQGGDDHWSGACFQISWAGGTRRTRDEAYMVFSDLFEDDAREIHEDQAYWGASRKEQEDGQFSCNLRTRKRVDNEVLQRRVLLLVMCAEMVERGLYEWVMNA